ncbi:unnamed protein product [Protopolystoma xenopodis]|uniref:Rho-GAP domain-containing protein n=1 Tax=Protopolystoma xenopodis TaxID=117903 RepID=A0A448XSW6_9PLAT|nr:unnamed protein product [Protopolystoma xenopodis]
MMDPYNLAICFGPTLMPVPAELDQVQYQSSVNEVVKTFIVYHADIFNAQLSGPKYDKYAHQSLIPPRSTVIRTTGKMIAG